MPGYKGHIAGGLLVYIAGIVLLQRTAHIPSLWCAAEWMICAIAGALFPDVDVKSKGQKYFYWVVLAIFMWLVMMKKLELLAFLSLVAITPMLVRHRGIFHELWFVIVMPLTLWAFMAMYEPCYARMLFFDTSFFIVGAISHLALDFKVVPALRAMKILKRPMR